MSGWTRKRWHIASFLLPTVLLTFAADGAVLASVERSCAVAASCGVPAPRRCDAVPRPWGDPPERAPELRCETLSSLAAAGFDANGASGHQMMRFLGREYLLSYEVAGASDVSADRLAYLLDHLPLAARLVDYFSGGGYYAEWVPFSGARWVRGGKGERFHGEAVQLAGSARRGVLHYLGYGTANIARWSFTGQVYLDFRFRRGPDGEGCRYLVRAVASPENAVINAIMDSLPFRYLTERVVEAIVDDLAQAVARLDAAQRNGKLDRSAFTPAELAEIDRLLALR
ncbi:MAG: hypothetical protein D6761_00045 [Candidatus Dadabacteria bacterium]|nr:MAG: hypothetical protein D6761_00045 [Candidatus Dadabacteria bacterium]